MTLKYFIKKIVTTLAFKTIVLMALAIIAIAFNLNEWSNESKARFTEAIFNSHEDLLSDIPKQKEDNKTLKTQAIFDKNRELVALISVIIREKKFYHKLEIIKELSKVFMKNDGIIAFKIIGTEKRTLTAMQKQNDNAIFVDRISSSIVNDKKLGFMKEYVSKNKDLGFIIVYFKLDIAKKDVDIAYISYVDKLNSFKYYLEAKSKELIQSNINYVALSFLAILLVIGLLILIIVDMPLRKLKAGINSFFLVFNNKTKEIHKIKIRTKDEFESIANFINEDITESLKIHNEIQVANKEMLLSKSRMANDTNYLLVTQNALMAKDNDMNTLFKEYFIYNKPKNEIGGDIYFFDKINDDEYVLMCFDSSKYNLSGVSASILIKSVQYHIIEYLKQAQSSIHPSKILSSFNKRIKTILRQENKRSESNTGFNGGIVCINKKTKKIVYSGAYMDLLYVEDKTVCVIPANKYSVGYRDCDMRYQYKEHIVENIDNFKFYLSTDGFFNQLEGSKDYRFGKKRLNQMIEKNHNKSFKEQKEIYIKTLADYQGSYEQVDDITFIGFKCDFK